VIRCHQVVAQVKPIRDGGVDIDELLRLKHGLEPSHSPLSGPGRLVRQLGSVVCVPTGVVRGARQQIATGHRIASQFARHDRPRLTTEAREQVSEEAPGGRRVQPLLEQHIDDLTILIDRSPQVPLPAPDRDEDLVHEDGVTVSAVPVPQSLRVPRSELVAPEADRFVGDQDSSPGQDVLDVPVAQVEAVLQPDGVLDDLGRKSVPPV